METLTITDRTRGTVTARTDWEPGMVRLSIGDGYYTAGHTMVSDDVRRLRDWLTDYLSQAEASK